MEAYKIYYTTAPESYDGFGTETIEMTGYFDTRGKELRKVKILDKSNNWQTSRYNSGMHGVFDQNDFDKLMAMDYPTFTRKEDPKKQEEKPKMDKTNNMDKQEIQNPTIENIKYISQSESCTSVDTIVPSDMRYDMLKAIETIDRRVNGVDEYVAEKLGYIVGNASMEEKKEGIKYLCDAFSSEQVDAIAVAIFNIESKGQGCIIGDQTGIGKGRIAAGMIRYGIKQGLKPIFITEKVNLFSDIFRDLISIGSDDDIPYKVLVGTELVEKKTIKKIKLTKEELAELEEEKNEEDNVDDEDDEEEQEFVEVENYEKNKNFPNKFIFIKKNKDDVEEKITRERKNSAVPFILNSKDPKTSKVVDIKDEDGHILYSANAKLLKSVLGYKQKTDEVIGTTKKGNPQYKQVFIQGTMQVPNGYDFILTTYSQFNKGINSPRGRFLFDMAKNNIVIMDESHNASGTSKVGTFLKDVLAQTLGVTFLSATFAKRPDNMPIYASKTSMSDANMKDEELISAIIKGGVALQQIVASALVSEGQMIRRQRSFEGIEVNYKFLDSTQKELAKYDLDLEDIHTAIMDRATDIIRNIIKFQKEYVDPVIKNMDKEFKQTQGQIKTVKGTEEGGIKNTPAFSGIFNLINQLLFSLKAEAVGKVAVERLREGKKPIISFASTMESFLNELRNEDGQLVKEGDIVNSDFSMVFEKRLKNTLRYKVEEADGEESFKYLNVKEMSENFQLEYKYIMAKINTTSIGICSSPIDIVIDVIKKAGYSVSEVTGRTRQFKILDNNKAQIKPKTKESPNDAFRKFNNNEIDVLMINQAGSTGASAHAVPTKKVSKEQVKQRVMIFLQSELNVNTEVQKRGRINRTGQILKPIYDYVISSVPSEKRLTMMLEKKLKSLSANTTSSQKQQDSQESEEDVKNIDFLNKYGDKVIYDFLIENPIINLLIDDPLKILSAEKPEDVDYIDASQKISGRVAILSIKDQNLFYTEIAERYLAYVTYLKEIDEYDLEVKDLDLNAETINKTISVVGKGGKSVFARNTMLEECLVNNLKKPYKSEEVEIILEKELNGLTAEQIKSNIKQSFTNFIDSKLSNDIRDLERYFADVIKNIPKQKAILKITDVKEQNEAINLKIEDTKKEIELAIENLKGITNTKKMNIINMFEYFYVGRPIYFPSATYVIDREKTLGLFVGFSISETDKNPYAPSSMKLKFALESSLKFVSVPASKFDILAIIKELTNDYISYYTTTKTILEDWDEKVKQKSEDRVKRYIITGNVLQGFGKPDMRGNLISYTTINGGVKKGILLPEHFVKSSGSSDANTIKVPIIKALPLIKDLSSGNVIETNGNLLFKGGGIDYYSNERYYYIEVPKSTKLGGKYFTDSTLIELSKNGTFNSSGQKMISIITSSNLTETIQYLQNRFNLAVELKPYQFTLIEDTIDIEEDYDDEVKIESDDFLYKLDEANRQEEERRKLEEERIAEEQRLFNEKREQESNNAKMLIEKKRQEVRGKFNTLISMLNKYINGAYEWKGNTKMGQGDNISDVKVVKNEDGTFYLTKIDATHFYLSNSRDFKGSAYSISEVRSEPYYNEVKSWLKSDNSKMEKGGDVSQSEYYRMKDGTLIPRNMVDEIKKSISMGYNEVVVGKITPTKKGCMLINKNYEVRGTYPLEMESLLKGFVENKKMEKGGRFEENGDDEIWVSEDENENGEIFYFVMEGDYMYNNKPYKTRSEAREVAKRIKNRRNSDEDEYSKGGVLNHKHSHTWGETITIRLIQPTSKGWKVEQTIVKGKSNPKTKIAFFSKEDIKDLFE